MALDYAADSNGENPFPETSQHHVTGSSPKKTCGSGQPRWLLPIFPPALTMLNIGQFLDRKPKEGDCTPWLLADAHALQHIVEAANGRMWHPSGVHFTLQISPLVDNFIKETGAEFVELNITSCWGQPPVEIPLWKQDGPFAYVITYWMTWHNVCQPKKPGMNCSSCPLLLNLACPPEQPPWLYPSPHCGPWGCSAPSEIPCY